MGEKSHSPKTSRSLLADVGVHELSPGLVLTDLLLRDTSPALRRFFNALAEEPETVAEALVPLMRDQTGSGGCIRYLRPFPDAPVKILSRFGEVSIKAACCAYEMITSFSRFANGSGDYSHPVFPDSTYDGGLWEAGLPWYTATVGNHMYP